MGPSPPRERGTADDAPARARRERRPFPQCLGHRHLRGAGRGAARGRGGARTAAGARRSGGRRRGRRARAAGGGAGARAGGLGRGSRVGDGIRGAGGRGLRGSGRGPGCPGHTALAFPGASPGGVRRRTFRRSRRARPGRAAFRRLVGGRQIRARRGLREAGGTVRQQRGRAQAAQYREGGSGESPAPVPLPPPWTGAVVGSHMCGGHTPRRHMTCCHTTCCHIIRGHMGRGREVRDHMGRGREVRGRRGRGGRRGRVGRGRGCGGEGVRRPVGRRFPAGAGLRHRRRDRRDLTRGCHRRVVGTAFGARHGAVEGAVAGCAVVHGRAAQYGSRGPAPRLAGHAGRWTADAGRSRVRCGRDLGMCGPRSLTGLGGSPVTGVNEGPRAPVQTAAETWHR